MSKPNTPYEPTTKTPTEYAKERIFSGTVGYSTSQVTYSSADYSYIGQSFINQVTTAYTGTTKPRTAYT